MSKISDELQAEASKPRRGFLIAAAVVSMLVVTAYVYEDDIILSSGPLAYGALLIILVLLALGLIVCYRTPRLGNRLLGYDVVIVNPDKKEARSDVQYSGGFKASDTAVETKRMNSRRKQARYSRRKLAQVTREMQQKKAEADSNGDTAE